MGADGGVAITKLEVIRDNWESIKTRLLEELNPNYEAYKAVKSWSNSAKFLSNESIVDLFKVMSCCDTPYLLGDTVLTSYGDNTYEDANTLSYVLLEFGAIFIETWT